MGAQCIKTGNRIVLRASGPEWSEPFEIGTTWLVSGHKTEQILTRGTHTFKEEVLNLQSAELILRNGEALIGLLSESKKFSGIGRVKAQRLWAEFGDCVFDVIENFEVEKLQSVLSEQSAQILCKEFQELGYIRALQQLMSKPLPSHVCINLVKAYGPEAAERVKEDPYRLLCFINSWKKVDDIALAEFAVARDDKRRMRAAVNEALISRFNLGNTAAEMKQVKTSVESINANPEFVRKAIEVEGGKLFKRSERLVHPTGPWIMETVVAEKINERLKSRSYESISVSNIEGAIEDYEAENRIELSIEQRDAILLSASEPFSLILGGAGCGKTTVLKGVYGALQAGSSRVNIHQIALSGRAAQRMAESTGLPAKTIAAFLQGSDSNVDDLSENDVVVIDEASMIDVVSAYYLMRRINPSVRIILVGDPEQLPPVGPGLFLHVLAEHKGIPKTTLRVVKRQAEDSGIVAVSTAIRAQRFPSFDHKDIGFRECTDSDLTKMAVDAYFEQGGTGENFDTVVVCATKSGAGSTSEINAQIVTKIGLDRRRVRTLWISSDGIEPVDLTINSVPVSLGDLVLITKNDYELEVRNGSLGRISRIAESDPEETNSVACWVDVEGQEVEIPVGKLGILDHGYAITVHKAQGSQFPRVIFPIRRSRLLDRSLVYTAITRAQTLCDIHGDRVAFEEACTTASKAHARCVGLAVALENALGH
ncbi:ATP-dependent DNA helicase [Marinobacter salarius]